VARVKSITIVRTNTFNIGDWESIKPTYGETWELEPGDDPAEIRKQVKNAVGQGFQRVTQLELRGTLLRRRNERDLPTEEYLDEICDFFAVEQKGRFRPQYAEYRKNKAALDRERD